MANAFSSANGSRLIVARMVIHCVGEILSGILFVTLVCGCKELHIGADGEVKLV